MRDTPASRGTWRSMTNGVWGGPRRVREGRHAVRVRGDNTGGAFPWDRGPGRKPRQIARPNLLTDRLLFRPDISKLPRALPGISCYVHVSALKALRLEWRLALAEKTSMPRLTVKKINRHYLVTRARTLSPLGRRLRKAD